MNLCPFWRNFQYFLRYLISGIYNTIALYLTIHHSFLLSHTNFHMRCRCQMKLIKVRFRPVPSRLKYEIYLEMPFAIHKFYIVYTFIDENGISRSIS